MVINCKQFQLIAPNASAETVDGLFAHNADGQTTIQRILDEHGITEPHVIAQFLTAAYLGSEGFTHFDRPVHGVAPLDWFTARAREWYEQGANEDADAWLWPDLIDGRIGTLFCVPVSYWNDVRQILGRICGALGVEDRSDKILPDD